MAIKNRGKYKYGIYQQKEIAKLSLTDIKHIYLVTFTTNIFILVLIFYGLALTFHILALTLFINIWYFEI